MFRTGNYKAKIVIAISGMLLCQGSGFSQIASPAPDFSAVHTEVELPPEEIDRCSYDSEARVKVACQDSVSAELFALGERGDLIARTRQQTLEILQTPNACSAWFEESDPHAAEIFRSLHYQLDLQGTSHVARVRNELGVINFKHPWGAKSTENAGSNSIIYLNANGPFFFLESPVTDLAGGIHPAWHWLKIGLYNGDTPESRVTILLHELGHIIGRLPVDNDSWGRQSSRNTTEVLQHCKRQIDLSARKASRLKK